MAAEYFEDGAAALKMLAATPGVDPKRIFLLGHSEGAMVAPRMAQDAGGVHGLVLMAPGVRPLDAMLIDQMAYGARLMGRTDEEIADQTKLMKEKFDAIRDPKRIDPPSLMGAPASYWREVLSLDVARSVRETKIPVLVLQGDKDVQVRKDLDFDALAKAVGTDGGRVTYRSFPDLNHLFMKVEGQSSGAETASPARSPPRSPARSRTGSWRTDGVASRGRPAPLARPRTRTGIRKNRAAARSAALGALLAIPPGRQKGEPP